MSTNTTVTATGSTAEKYFGYDPSLAAGVIAILMYFTISLPLFRQSYRSGNRLTYVLPITALVETAGYIIRCSLTTNFSLGGYVFMGLLIILAPNALAFVNYKVLGKIIQSKAMHLHLPSSRSHLANAQLSVLEVPPTNKKSENAPRCTLRIPYLMNEHGEVHGARLASFFFVSDILAIFIQGNGGGLQGAGNADLGTDLLLFGLISQLLFFGVFTALTVYVFKSPLYQQSIFSTEQNTQSDELQENTSDNGNVSLTKEEYRKAFIGLFATITLLFVRNFYRIIEFSGGYRGYLATTEVFMYLFDALIIFIAFVLYIHYDFAEFLCKVDLQLKTANTLNMHAVVVEDSKYEARSIAAVIHAMKSDIEEKKRVDIE